MIKFLMLESRSVALSLALYSSIDILVLELRMRWVNALPRYRLWFALCLWWNVFVCVSIFVTGVSADCRLMIHSLGLKELSRPGSLSSGFFSALRFRLFTFSPVPHLRQSRGGLILYKGFWVHSVFDSKSTVKGFLFVDASTSFDFGIGVFNKFSCSGCHIMEIRAIGNTCDLQRIVSSFSPQFHRQSGRQLVSSRQSLRFLWKSYRYLLLLVEQSSLSRCLTSHSPRGGARVYSDCLDVHDI